MCVAKNRTLSCSYVTALGWFLTVYYNWAMMELQIVVCYSSWTPHTSHFKEQKYKIKARTPYHMSARTEDGRPDCKKKVRAWSPMRNMKERLWLYGHGYWQASETSDNLSTLLWSRSSKGITTLSNLFGCVSLSSFLRDSCYQMSSCNLESALKSTASNSSKKL